MLWEAADPYLYIRTTPDGHVLCGGGDEDFKDEESRDALLPNKIEMLQKKLSELLPQLDAKAQFAWCGSFGVSAIGLPGIGPVPGQPRCFAILAFGGSPPYRQARPGRGSLCVRLMLIGAEGRKKGACACAFHVVGHVVQRSAFGKMLNMREPLQPRAHPAHLFRAL